MKEARKLQLFSVSLKYKLPFSLTDGEQFFSWFFWRVLGARRIGVGDECSGPLSLDSYSTSFLVFFHSLTPLSSPQIRRGAS
jgi:hypothetical protein